MNFYFANVEHINKFSNTDLCVLLDNVNLNVSKCNIVVPYSGIFEFNNESENDYYLIVAKRMKSAGFDGFMDWITKLINEFNTHIYHDEFDKPITYKSIVFLTDTDVVKRYINNIFTNFGFQIKDFKSDNFHKNVLF